MLLFELCQCTLWEKLCEEPRRPPREARQCASAVGAALAHLHRCHTIHTDVKPDNIFYSAAGTVKLGDLGGCVHATPNGRRQQEPNAIGTPFYQAPEIQRGELYSFNVDCWSLGVVLLEMTTGIPAGDLWDIETVEAVDLDAAVSSAIGAFGLAAVKGFFSPNHGSKNKYCHVGFSVFKRTPVK